jgi:hypothetical protein
MLDSLFEQIMSQQCKPDCGRCPCSVLADIPGLNYLSPRLYRVIATAFVPLLVVTVYRTYFVTYLL